MPSALNTASLLPGRSARWDGQGLVTEIVEQYQVLRAFAGSQYDPNAITGMPQRGDAHPVFSALVVQAHDPREDAQGVRWVVDVRYGRRGLTVEAGGFKARRVWREWGFLETTREMAYDALGNPLLNAAGDPFDRAPQIPHCDLQVQIRRLENTAPATVMAYNNTINSAALTLTGGIACGTYKGRLLVTGRETDPTGTGTPDYRYEYTYNIVVRVNPVKIDGVLTDIGWDEGFIQRGFYYLVGSARTRAVETVDLGPPEGEIARPTADPVLLAADGTLLADGQPPVVTRKAAIPSADWSTLHLDL